MFNNIAQIMSGKESYTTGMQLHEIEIFEVKIPSKTGKYAKYRKYIKNK